MPTRLLPLEPVVAVPVYVDNEETPLQLYALEAARSPFGLVANIQALSSSYHYAQVVCFGDPADRRSFNLKLRDALSDQDELLLVPPSDIERALIELQTGVEQALRHGPYAP